MSNLNHKLIIELKQDYETKNKKIKKRLNEFRKFFNQLYSWFYINNELKFLPVDKNNNERLFEELCFCIFTANTSAEMGLKAVDAARNVLINGNADGIKKRLVGIYRFNNVRPKYIVHTRNYLKNAINFELKNKIKSFNGKEELRQFFAKNRNIKGIGMKEASHFLRNIGFKGYSILDKHIINSLFEFGVLETNNRPKNKEEYLAMEEKFKEFSKNIGIDMDELDLLLWSRKNGRILK